MTTKEIEKLAKSENRQTNANLDLKLTDLKSKGCRILECILYVKINQDCSLIEVPLVFGQEFGDLDPYFFSKFIKSTPKYKPLPVDIFEDYDDGARINEKMLSLGKFERISSNVGNHYEIVVADRQKVEIKSYLDLEKMYQEQNKQTEKPKFNFWKFTGLKR